VSTFQDGRALAERGHLVDIHYTVDGSYRPEYAALGIEMHGPIDFGFHPGTMTRDLLKFIPSARWARRSRPDVLWLTREEHLVWGQAVGRWAGSPVVAHLHVLPALRHTRLISAGIAHFVAVSEFVRQAYIAEGIRPERISLLHNAIPAEDYPHGGLEEQAIARRQLGLPLGVPIVLAYGQMTEEKGIATLLTAWRAIVERRSGAVLVLVNAKSEQNLPLQPALALALRDLDPSSYRIFPVRHDVVPFLHAADVVAFPTHLPETFGRVIIEGMATGRPVVSSRIGAVPEILSGPMSRFLVAPGSVPELATKLDSLLDWRHREPGLGLECSDWVEQRFPFSAHADGLESILHSHSRARRSPRLAALAGR
jgi:glycosyltransferase involved in cell wall biosynthesis